MQAAWRYERLQNLLLNFRFESVRLDSVRLVFRHRFHVLSSFTQLLLFYVAHLAIGCVVVFLLVYAR